MPVIEKTGSEISTDTKLQSGQFSDTPIPSHLAK